MFLVVYKVQFVGAFPINSIRYIDLLLFVSTLLLIMKDLSLGCKDWCLTSV